MKTERGRRDLKGLVKSVHEQTTEFAKVGAQLVEQLWLIQTTIYDREGRVIELVFYNARKPENAFTSTYKYQCTGSIEECPYFHNGAPAGKKLLTLDRDGNLLEEASYSVDGSEIERKVIAYSSSGKKTEQLVFDYRKHEPGTLYGHGLDADGITDFGFTVDGARLIKTLYDGRGNPEQVQFLDPGGDGSFDSHNTLEKYHP